MAPTYIWSFALSLFASIATSQSLTTANFTSCSQDTPNQFNVTTFNATLTPSNKTLSYSLSGTTSVSGNTSLSLTIAVNNTGYHQGNLDPCTAGLADLCPITAGPVNITSNQELSSNAFNLFGDEAIFNTTNLDTQIRLELIDGATSEPFGCAVAYLTNGREQVNLTGSPTSSGHATSSSSGPTPTMSRAGRAVLDWRLAMVLLVLMIFWTTAV